MAIKHLLARIGIDKTEFDTGLKAAGLTTEKFTKDIGKKIGQGFGVAAILAFTQSVVDAGKEVDDLIAKLGKTGEEAQLIRLRKQLGGETEGNFTLLMTDKDLENLRILDRTFSKIKESGKSLFAAMLPLSTGLSGLIGLSKATGFVSGLPPHDLTVDERAERARQLAAEAHRNIQERIVQLEKDAAEINEKTRISQLTREQRLNELIAERVRLQEKLFRDAFPGTEEEKAQAVKRLAEVEAGIVEAGKTEKHGSFSAGGIPGVFAGPSVDSLQRETVTRLSAIERALTVSGIIIRDMIVE